MVKSYTLAEHEQSMTIFYYTRTGKIYSWGTGIIDFDTFGEHSQEYELILGRLVLPKDMFILDNMKMFMVDTENQAITYNSELMKKYSLYK